MSGLPFLSGHSLSSSDSPPVTTLRVLCFLCSCDNRWGWCFQPVAIVFVFAYRKLTLCQALTFALLLAATVCLSTPQSVSPKKISWQQKFLDGVKKGCWFWTSCQSQQPGHVTLCTAVKWKQMKYNLQLQNLEPIIILIFMSLGPLLRNFSGQSNWFD